MAEDKRAWSSHRDCEHPDTKGARKQCRHVREHADCDHPITPRYMAWCTHRRKKAEEVTSP